MGKADLVACLWRCSCLGGAPYGCSSVDRCLERWHGFISHATGFRNSLRGHACSCTAALNALDGRAGVHAPALRPGLHEVIHPLSLTSGMPAAARLPGRRGRAGSGLGACMARLGCHEHVFSACKAHACGCAAAWDALEAAAAAQAPASRRYASCPVAAASQAAPQARSSR